MRGSLDMRWLAGSLALVGWALSGAWACGASLPGPRLCSQRDPCQNDGICVLGRCRDEGTMPVSTEAPRLTFEPVDLAYITGEGVQGPAELDEALVIGQRGHSAQLVMRFAVSWPEGERLQRALLVMDPLPRCAPQPGRVRLELAHVTAPWLSGALTEAQRPELSLPMHAGEIRVTPPSPLRLDVTEVVRDWAAHRKRHHGLALSGVGDSPSGACFTSGVAWGQGPRLEIYLWPEEDGEGGGGGAGGGAGGGEGGAGGGDRGGGKGGRGAADEANRAEGGA